MVDNTHQRRRVPTGTVFPPPYVALAMREAIAREGEGALASRMGIGRTTVARIAGRLTCRRGSILLAANWLGIDL
jgi:hypothetical protein